MGMKRQGCLTLWCWRQILQYVALHLGWNHSACCNNVASCFYLTWSHDYSRASACSASCSTADSDGASLLCVCVQLNVSIRSALAAAGRSVLLGSVVAFATSDSVHADGDWASTLRVCLLYWLQIASQLDSARLCATACARVKWICSGWQGDASALGF